MKVANRLFALFFFVAVGLWVIWQPIMWNITGEEIPITAWYHGYLIYATVMVGYPIVLLGLAYEICWPSLNFEWDRDWRWISVSVFLLLVAVTIILVQAILKPFDPGYSLFGLTEFEFPRGSGRVYVWPNYLWELFGTFCMETTSFSLLFGLLFMTKSTPQTSKGYKIMLIGAIAFEILPMLTYFLLFFMGVGVGPYVGMTRMQLLTTYWFHWDFWSELAILVSAVYLLKKGKDA